MKNKIFMIAVLSLAQWGLCAMKIAEHTYEVPQELVKAHSELGALIVRKKTKMKEQELYLSSHTENGKAKLVMLIAESDEAELQYKSFELQNNLEQEKMHKDLAIADLRLAVLRQLSNGEFPLHLAVRYRSIAIVEKLLAEKADSDARDAMGRTPLHYAVEQLNKPLVELLLKSGANASVRDKLGLTSIELVRQQGSVGLKRSFDEVSREIEALLRSSLCFICSFPLHPLENTVHISKEHCRCLIHSQCREALFEDASFSNACPVCHVAIPKEIDECPICTEEFDEDHPGVIGKNCTHRLHPGCQRDVLDRKDECPICRQPIKKIVRKK